MADAVLSYKPPPVRWTTPCGVSSSASWSSPLWEQRRLITVAVKRVRPQGVERLFQPTNWQRRTTEVKSNWSIPPLAATCIASTNPTVYKTAAVRPSFFKEEYGLSYPNPTIVPNYNALKSKMLGKIKGEGVNLWMQLATYRQTATVFRDGVGALWKLYKQLRRGRIREAFKTTQGFYLYNRYGLNPFLMDVQSSLALLHEDLTGEPVKRFVCTQKETKNYTRTYGSPAFPRYVVEESEARMVTWVQFDTALARVPSKLGLSNPTFALWDIVPFSFVIDWFIDVGGYLNGLDALLGVKRHSTVTVQVSRLRELGVKPTMSGTATYRQYNRSVYTTLGSPSLNFWTGINLTHTLDSLNLLGANIRTRR